MSKKRFYRIVVFASIFLMFFFSSVSFVSNGIEFGNAVYASDSMVIVFSESTNSSQSQTVDIPYLQSMISVTVDTGTVAYYVDGVHVTINVSNGSPTRVYTPSRIQTDYRTSSTNSFPASVPYNSEGYSGTLYKSGSSYVISGTSASSKTVTVYSPTNTVTSTGWTNPWVTTSTSSSYTPPTTWAYSDSEGYAGTLPRTGTNELTSNPDHGAYHFGTPVNGRTPWTCHRYYQAIYSGTVTKPDTRVWRQNYSGTVYGSSTYYYSYNVTITYTAFSLENVNLRVLLNSTFYDANPNGDAKAADYVDTAKYPFAYRWNITLNPSYTMVGPLPVESCGLALNDPCSDNMCGTAAQCNNYTTDEIHHKNIYKNLNVIKNNFPLPLEYPYNLMTTFIGTYVCGKNGGDHIFPAGLGDVNGKYSICTFVSTASDNFKVRLLQHELTHNFGPVHCENIPSGDCIMKGSYDLSPYQIVDIWCSYCEAQFNRTQH